VSDAVPSLPSADAVAPVAAAATGVKGETTTTEPTRAQQVIARRAAETKATVPEFTLQGEIDMEAVVAFRAERRAAANDGAPVPTINDLIVKACALALREHPQANGAYRDAQFQRHERINVGIVVAAPGILVIPVVLDADVRSLDEIAATTRTLAERARAGTITPPELSGGTFTVSNLGMHDVDAFTAVITAPQSALLTVGTVARRPVNHEEQLALRFTTTVTLVCDHRILYGVDAAAFLGRIRALLQDPAALAT